MTEAPLLAAAVRWGTFAAILVVIGAAAFRVLVLGRLAGAAIGRAERVGLVDACERLAATWCLAGAAALVLLAAARLGLQVAELRDPGDPWTTPAGMMLFETTWGIGWWGQVGAAIVGGLGCALVRARHGGFGWSFVALAAVALATTPALSGHAVGAPRLTNLAVVADTAHVLGAGAWIGTLVIALLTVIGGRRTRSSAVVAVVVRTFSPVALAGAALVVASGVFASWLHLDALASLWTTAYGRFLLAKLALFTCVVVLGAFNWRRVTPRLGSDAGNAALCAAARAELVAAALVLVATVVLVATPLPGE